MSDTQQDIINVLVTFFGTIAVLWALAKLAARKLDKTSTHRED